MASNHSSGSEGEITLGLLRAVEGNADLTQRTLANELGIALGLVNTYLKRCVGKGYIKIRQVPRNRYAYFLTPTGFAEKSRLTAEYLYQSLSLFRQAHSDYKKIFEVCQLNGWTRLCLCGCSDLADIAILVSKEFAVDIVGIYDPKRAPSSFHGQAVFGDLAEAGGADVFVITSLGDVQELYGRLIHAVRPERVLAPALIDARLPVAAGESP